MQKQNSLNHTEFIMNETNSQNGDTGSLVGKRRSVGVIAIVYAGSILVQNGLFAFSGSPGYSDPLSAVLTYHADNQGVLSVTSGLESINMVLLLLLITSLHGLVKRRGGLGEYWSRLAMIAGSALSVMFGLTIATHIAVIIAANNLSEANGVFEMMWRLHAATFALAMPALGLTFIGTALATHSNGLTRPWHLRLGLIGGSLPLLAGIGNLAIAGGSPVLYIGVLGLFLWLIWLILLGLRLIRL